MTNLNLPPAPADVHECSVFKRLLETSTPRDGLSAKSERFVNIAGPLLDSVGRRAFGSYTLHNRDHAKKVLHLAGYLIPQNTLSELSALESAMLVFSSYLHDMGMALTEEKRMAVLGSDEFLALLETLPEVSRSLAECRKKLDSAEPIERIALENKIFELEELALTRFLRDRHAIPVRYRELLATIDKVAGEDLFEVEGVPFRDYLVDVCASHGNSATQLAEISGPYTEAFPRAEVIAGQKLNVQFCAAVLRIADAFDFDRERRPRVLFQSLGISASALPGSGISLQEWERHQATHSVDVTDQEIVVMATCHHPVIEGALRAYCSSLETEVRETLAVLRQNREEIAKKYILNVPPLVRAKVRSVGYIYKDLSFKLNQPAIMDLLMGGASLLSPRRRFARTSTERHRCLQCEAID